MIKYIRIIILLPAFLLTGCERDLTSSSDYSKTESVSLIKPGGGERYTVDQSIDVEWMSININDDMRIELINDNQSVYSVNNIPNTGYYSLPVPSEIVPSDKYQLKIESMLHPEIYDLNKTYFEIAPLINGRWYYSGVTETTSLELDLELTDFVSNTFTGSGYLHFTYLHYGEPVTYESTGIIGGIVSFPDIGFYMREEGGKQFDFTGKMITNSEISGRIIGNIDPVYGNLNDTLTLVRQ